MISIIDEISLFHDFIQFKTTDCAVGIVGKTDIIDVEQSVESVKNLRNFINAAPTGLQLKFKLIVKGSRDPFWFDNNRRIDISRIGYTNSDLYILLEYIPNFVPFFLKKKNHNDLFDFVQTSPLPIRRATIDEFNSLIIDASKLRKCATFITDGAINIGVVRLNQLTVTKLTEFTLPEILLKLPKPFEVCFTVKKVPRDIARIQLERRLKQTSLNSSISDSVIAESNTLALSKILQTDNNLFDYELVIIITRLDEKSLKQDLALTRTALSSLGDAYIETFGVGASYAATLPGSRMHVPNRDFDDVVSLLIPATSFGGDKRTLSNTKRSLVLHRIDDSLYTFDLFNSQFNVYNTLIVGTSGKGKSVLTGLLTRSLLYDDNVRVIKIDVGGSHSKECELLGGREYIMRLSDPSGINPFDVCKTVLSAQDKISILSNFILSLIREPDERFFSRDLRAGIENAIANYLEVAKTYSLQEFYRTTKDSIPRSSYLARWVSGGIYENAFKLSNQSDLLKEKLIYFNFAEVYHASDPEFAQGAIAAVLALFNTYCTTTNERIVLICDETPFFIKSNFEFFKFTTANVRKFGHAVVLIAQLSSDFVVNNDHGIIQNSPQRFLFSKDGSDSEFIERFSLSKNELLALVNLKTVAGKYSEVLFQHENGSCVLRVKVTPEEYWALSTSKSDRDKLTALRKFVPNLTLEEAIRCLAVH